MPWFMTDNINCQTLKVDITNFFFSGWNRHLASRCVGAKIDGNEKTWVTTRLTSKKRKTPPSPTANDKPPSLSSPPRSTKPRPSSPPATSTPSTHPAPTPSTSQTLPQQTISTIGHGTRSLDALIAILHAAHITTLVDIRSIPRSRTNPQFNRDALTSSAPLREQNIAYVWMGDTLGGRRNAQQPDVARHTALRVLAFRNYAAYMGTEGFRRGLRELKESSAEAGGGVAVMCSETVWWRCHRRMVADVLVTDGWRVRHLGLGGKGEAPEHRRWDVCRVGEDGGLVYDVALK